MTFEFLLHDLCGENDKRLSFYKNVAATSAHLSFLASPLSQKSQSNNMLPSFNQDHQIRNYDSKADVEFKFWAANNIRHKPNINHENGCQKEQQENSEEEFDDYSVQVWKKRTSRNIEKETAYLLPHHHNYSNSSPKSQSEAIANARTELMKRIHDMPESSYELSLKDVVDEELILNAENEENTTEGTSFRFNNSEPQIKKKQQQTRYGNKSGQVSRSGSMEKETFMIKMFIPSSISWKTKVKGRKCSRIIRRSENHAEKHQAINRFQAIRDGKGTNRSNSSNYSSKCFFLGCYPFFCKKTHRLVI